MAKFLLYLEFQMLLRFVNTLIFVADNWVSCSLYLRWCNYPFVQDTIKNAIEDSITWPVRKVIPIIPGDYR